MLRKGDRSFLPNSIEKKSLSPLSLLVSFFFVSFGNYQISLPEVLCKKGAYKNFTKFIGLPAPESLFNKVAEQKPATLLKKRL